MQLTKVQKFLIARRLEGNVVNTALLMLLAALLALIPLPLLSFPAAWLFLLLLPGLQMARALGFYATWREGRTLILGTALGLLVAPLFIYWTSLLFGFTRLLVFIIPALLALGLAWLNDWRRLEPRPALPLASSRRQYLVLGLLLLMLLVCLVIPYIEGHTSAGVYPVEMADWFKHYGVSWSLRHTGVPPADVFFYGDPNRGKLSYYYFFHLTTASLDLLHGGESAIYFSFVILTLTAAFSFVLVFYLLARQVLGVDRAALWSLLFVTLIGGLDVIPIIPHSLKRFNNLFPDTPLTFTALLSSLDHIDAWTPAPSLRLNPLFVQYLWVPQHVTGLLAFFLGLYCFREVRQRSRLMIAAPLILLAILGHSAWIAMIAFICLALYALIDLVRTSGVFSPLSPGERVRERGRFTAFGRLRPGCPGTAPHQPAAAARNDRPACAQKRPGF
ncbi:MAG: hypothetical protein HC875_37045 [Anaerolineales bacterium]|nr:hypothetical protein [Anaerolineales bacterium]